MKVIIKRPCDQFGEEATIPNTLEALQKTIGGYIETVTLDNGVVLICNEEGRIRNMPYNFTLRRMRGVVTIQNAIFGTVIAMRVLMIFIPIIIGPRLQIFPHDSIGYTVLDIAAKVIMIYAGFEVVKKANGIITGILADSAGWQSIQAGDSTMRAEQAIAKTTAGIILPFSVAWGATKLAGSGVKKLFSSSGSSGGGGGSEASSGGSSGGGGGGGGSDLPENKNK